MEITRFSMEITEQLQCSELAMQLRPGRWWRQPLFQHGFRGSYGSIRIFIGAMVTIPSQNGGKNGMVLPTFATFL